MSWRSIFLSQPCKLKLKNHNLCYVPQVGNEQSFPLEDISVIVADTPQVVITNPLLSKFAEHGIIYFSTDGHHLPNGVFTPFNSNSRVAENSYAQINSKKVLEKNIWQAIVKQKVLNQAKVLQLNNFDSQKLLDLAQQIKSNDSTNIESQTAQIYFVTLFGEDFTRRNDSENINALLNYGYSILRGTIARNIVASGLQPWHGIWHSSTLNPFNLADDLIEPYRPFMDYNITANHDLNEDLNTLTKSQIVSFLDHQCLINNNQTSILNAISRTTASLVRVFMEKDIKELALPTFKE